MKRFLLLLAVLSPCAHAAVDEIFADGMDTVSTACVDDPQRIRMLRECTVMVPCAATACRPRPPIRFRGQARETLAHRLPCRVASPVPPSACVPT